jgi:hypothetical protein
LIRLQTTTATIVSTSGRDRSLHIIAWQREDQCAAVGAGQRRAEAFEHLREDRHDEQQHADGPSRLAMMKTTTGIVIALFQP